MKLLFNLKSLGKKRPFLKEHPIDLEINSRVILKEFLEILVAHQVDEYNRKREQPGFIQFLSEGAMSQANQTGKVGFGEIYNDTTADQSKAIGTVFQAFEDGLIAIFINDDQIEDLNAGLNLKEEASISIIKLSFLTGTIF
ncbi:hypothetical protein EYV94_13590 [Puteibacter caeruleilacunae]|nr:hypothetical protein EYV94_13590 [Puteibacter caeruleilacunae]